MGSTSKNVHIRMPPELAGRFEQVAAEFPGLHRGTVLRLLIAGQLKRPVSENVELVVSQIRRSSGKRETVPGPNTKNRITQV
jgi:hypothetical protein